LGINVAYDPRATDRELVTQSVAKERAILTRDRRLLMHAAVRDGYYPRSQIAAEQTREVVQRFELGAVLAPFTRCLRCNGTLETIPKAEVFDQLEPLTKIYYEAFRRCQECGQIYWGGSHFEKLQRRLAQLTAN
jgi:hypothetical protein